MSVCEGKVYEIWLKFMNSQVGDGDNVHRGESSLEVKIIN